jgi:cytochrome c
MCNWPDRLALALVLGCALAMGTGSLGAQGPDQQRYPGIGRAATAAEVAAWDIDVRPDFKGLPKGSGSVANGQVLWEAKCASCHGIFGESNEVFSPMVGGTTKDDVKTGRVARLNDASFPGRTTMMKLSSLSTLWDYIHRAMPWNAPKSLATDEVYALTAYVLNMAGVLPDNFTLSDSNIAEVQGLLPNRNGVTTDHGLWPGKGLGNGGKPDVRAVACMQDCIAAPGGPALASVLPDFARNNHGNLADQQRRVGPQRGAATSEPAPANPSAPVTAAAASGYALAQKHACTACHGAETKIVGPGFKQIASKYAGRADAAAMLAGRIRSGGQGQWGPIAMPAQTLPDADLQAIASWLAGGAQK